MLDKKPVLPPRPVRPGTVAVRLDHAPSGRRTWVMVSATPVSGFAGDLRRLGESHAGLYVYPFGTWRNAYHGARTALRKGWVTE